MNKRVALWGKISVAIFDRGDYLNAHEYEHRGSNTGRMRSINRSLPPGYASAHDSTKLGTWKFLSRNYACIRLDF
jgi:hypothetical protein